MDQNIQEWITPERVCKTVPSGVGITKQDVVARLIIAFTGSPYLCGQALDLALDINGRVVSLIWQLVGQGDLEWTDRKYIRRRMNQDESQPHGTVSQGDEGAGGTQQGSPGQDPV